MNPQNFDCSACRLTLISIALMTAFTGCAFIESHPNSSSMPGVSYYLPLRPVELTFTRSSTLNPDKKNCDINDTVKITMLPLVADASKRYTLALDHNAFRSDKMVVTTTPSGLLTTSSASSTDQTASIVVALAQANAAVATLSGSPLKNNRVQTYSIAASPQIDCSSFAHKVEQVLNPRDDLHLSDFALELTHVMNDGRYELKHSPLVKHNEIDVPASESKSGKFPGIAYRRDQTHVLRFLRDGATIVSVLIELPQGAPIEMIELKASFGNTVTLDSTFENGMLTKHTDTRPSEALAIAAIPFEVAKAALAVPASLLKLQVTNITESNSLTAQLRAQICAEEKLSAVKEQRPVNAALCLAN